MEKSGHQIFSCAEVFSINGVDWTISICLLQGGGSGKGRASMGLLIILANWTSLRGVPGREASKTKAEWSTSG